MVNMLGRAETLAKMKRGFYPRNIAVVGAARHNNFRWVKSFLPFHESRGKVYHVNIDEDEWPGAQELGVEAFHSLLDIPEPVDYVLVTVPRKVAPRIVEDAIKKDVAVVAIYTAGFEESGEDEGIRLDHEISELARKSGLLIMGPNCMGLFNPSAGLRQGENQYYGEGGHFGYISQSGSMAVGMSMEANAHGIRMSKSMSMGNGMVLDAPDYMEYLADDPDTKVVGMYLEGLRNPQRFFRSLQDLTKKKHALVWKVGQTEDSARATEAHTGTSFINEALWNALLVRCGAIAIESQEEMIDTVKALTQVPPVVGQKVGLFASTGGRSTDMANVFSKNGFKVVPLTDHSYEDLGSFFSLIGGNYVNPIQQAPPEHFERIVNILVNDENLDLVAVELQTSRMAADKEFFEDRLRIFKEAQARSPKPLVAIVANSYPRLDPKVEEDMDRRFTQEGIAAFGSFLRGARAIRHVVNHYSVRKYLGE